jgi:hypothetical protein
MVFSMLAVSTLSTNPLNASKLYVLRERLQLKFIKLILTASPQKSQPEKSPLDSVPYFQNICVSHDAVTRLLGHVYVWFAEERTWKAMVTRPAPAESHPDEKGPLHIFDCQRKNPAFCGKCGYFAEKSGFAI